MSSSPDLATYTAGAVGVALITLALLRSSDLLHAFDAACRRWGQRIADALDPADIDDPQPRLVVDMRPYIARRTGGNP